ncbi:MAG TPA: fused MFS/spermidine synthase [Allosphingosinicella sp.]|jgi:SAM-dependent methyltransferase|nr:fused MFS/spermidine synthase [Allosphingosinicella sp.]
MRLAQEMSQDRERFARPLFLLTVLTGSFLLFLTQPMIARMALPRLGGAPAVWNSAMLVYQGLLLAGYAYAHFLTRLRPRRQAGLHLALFAVAALWLPIGVSEAVLPADSAPALWAPWFLASSIGPLFFIVSAQAPLMQRWYALEGARGDPYPLYAASNLGSFAGLLSYPLLVEPLLTLKQQSLLWSAGYALLVLMVMACALTVPAAAVEEAPKAAGPAPPLRRLLHWVALAAVPSGLMLSTTTHLTTDIVAVPLLWVLPLALYLLSFVIAFAHRRGTANLIVNIAPLFLLVAGGFAFSGGSELPFVTATLGLLLLFIVAVALHAEMYRRRPEPAHLTAFYLAMAVGGVLGGMFCAILAPTLFDWAYEHPLLIVAAALLIPQSPFIPWAQDMPARLRWLAAIGALALSWAVDFNLGPFTSDGTALVGSILISLVALAFIGWPTTFALGLAALMLSYGGWTKLDESRHGVRTRSYFGVYTVLTRRNPPSRQLAHGTTLHGVQNLTPGGETEPTSYYARRSGVGHALGSLPVFHGPNAAVGVVGLGTGTLSCYAQPGQDWRFFEIDPAIVRIARDPAIFTFLSRCAPQAKVVLGDARLSLSREPAGRLDLLAVDAFSSDAIPIHLLTREALQVYRRALKPDGLLLVHISNRYLDLEPVLAAAAKRDGWRAAAFDYAPEADEIGRNLSRSIWVAMAKNEETLMTLRIATAEDAHLWRPLLGRPGFPGWTDDYASILPLLEDWRAWLPGVLKP